MGNAKVFTKDFSLHVPLPESEVNCLRYRRVTFFPYFELFESFVVKHVVLNR